jgi:hypothetical protein
MLGSPYSRDCRFHGLAALPPFVCVKTVGPSSVLTTPHTPNSTNTCTISMAQKSPKRIILRFHEKYEHEPERITRKFFETINIDHKEDYFPHLCPPDDSPKMHVAVDLYCKSFPSVNLDEILHEVYRVKKTYDL